MPNLNEQLLPCPFCGGEARISNHSAGGASSCAVICGGCAAASGWTFGDTDAEAKARATEIWNRRQHGSAAQAVAQINECEQRSGFKHWGSTFWRDASQRDYDEAPAEHRRILFTAPPVADAEGVKAVRDELSAALDSIGWDERFPQDQSAAYDRLREAMTKARDDLDAALSRRPAAAPEPSIVAEFAADPGLLPLPIRAAYGIKSAYGFDPADKHAQLIGLSLQPSGSYFGPNQVELFTAEQTQEYARAHLRAAGQGSKDSERLEQLIREEFNRYCDIVPVFGAKPMTFEEYRPKALEKIDAAIDAAKAKGAEGAAD